MPRAKTKKKNWYENLKEQERAGLVATAYVIGFTTAFIAFAINPTLKAEYHRSSSNVQPSKHYNSEYTASSISAFTNDEGLFARINGNDRLLSAKVEENPTGMAGEHTAVHAVEVSADGRFIHYCEQMSDEATKCSHYIYRVATDSVVRVTVDGTPLQSDIDQVKVSWTDDDRLVVNDFVSTDNIAPWRVENN